MLRGMAALGSSAGPPVARLFPSMPVTRLLVREMGGKRYDTRTAKASAKMAQRQAARAGQRGRDRVQASAAVQAGPEPGPAAGRSGASAAEDAWLGSEERSVHLSRNERLLIGLAVASSCLAIGGFTMVKWDVEEKLKALPPEQEKAWRDGTYRPPAPDAGGKPAAA